MDRNMLLQNKLTHSHKTSRKFRAEQYWKGGAGGVMREPWKSKTILLASREGCERTERERAWEDLVTGRARTTPPNPPFARGGKTATPFARGGKTATPFARGGKGRNEIGMKAQLVQNQLFTSPPRHP